MSPCPARPVLPAHGHRVRARGPELSHRGASGRVAGSAACSPFVGGDTERGPRGVGVKRPVRERERHAERGCPVPGTSGGSPAPGAGALRRRRLCRWCGRRAGPATGPHPGCLWCGSASVPSGRFCQHPGRARCSSSRAPRSARPVRHPGLPAHPAVGRAMRPEVCVAGCFLIRQPRLDDARPLSAYDACAPSVQRPVRVEPICSSSGSTAGSSRNGCAYSAGALSQARFALTAGLVMGVPIFPITHDCDDQRHLLLSILHATKLQVSAVLGCEPTRDQC